MELNDLHRLIVVQNQVIEGNTRTYRVMLDHVFIGELEGEGYLSCNMISGRHTLELLDGRFSIASKGFTVRDEQHMTRAFVRGTATGKAVITIDNGVSDEPYRPEEMQRSSDGDRGVLRSSPVIVPQPASAPRRRGTAAGRVLGYLVTFALGLIAAWIYFRFL